MRNLQTNINIFQFVYVLQIIDSWLIISCDSTVFWKQEQEICHSQPLVI